MIPKIIHYCWFGKGELPKRDQECIDSWKKYMPDYEIKRWDESNFDIGCCQYANAAYAAGKWAYVSDYARFDILYQEGGLFFDTDVKVIRAFDDLLGEKCFFGVERPNYSVAPGLAIGAEKQNECIKKIRDFYQTSEFLDPRYVKDAPTSPVYVTKVLKEMGFIEENRKQSVSGVTVYPYDYFAPMDMVTGLTEITENTYSIHLYNTSWETEDVRIWHERRYRLNRKFGVKNGRRIYLLWSFPHRVYKRLRSQGIRGTILYIQNRRLRK